MLSAPRWIVLLLLLAPLASRADEDPPDLAPDHEAQLRAPGGLNIAFVQLGGQIEIAEYRSGFQLAGGYQRYLKSIMWLDLASSVVVHRNTNWALDGGVRWKFARSKSGVEAYVRTLLEFAVFAESQAQYFFGARFGGGAAYYSSPGFGASMEATISVGPAFGAGSKVASSLELLLGVEFPF
jgi:hypothetical protein